MKTATYCRYAIGAKMKPVRSLMSAAITAMALVVLVAAAPASASWSEVGNKEWNGQTANEGHLLTFNGKNLRCYEADFSGVTTENGSELVVDPSLEGCSWLGVNTQWAINGCKYDFHIGGAEGESQHVGKVDIFGCDEPMSWTITSGGLTCTITIDNQNGIEAAGTSVGGSGAGLELTLEATLKGIKYTQSGNWCGSSPGTYTDGTYTGVWHAENLGQWHEPAVPYPTLFKVDSAPAALGGSAVESQRFRVAGRILTCSEVGYGGTVGATAVESLTLTPTYGNCYFIGVSTSVDMGGCVYTVEVDGDFEIGGMSCGSDPIEFSASVFGLSCTVTVGPQSGTMALADDDSKGVRGISMTPDGLSEVEYTATGKACSKTGVFSDGQIEGASKIDVGDSNELWLSETYL